MMDIRKILSLILNWDHLLLLWNIGGLVNWSLDFREVLPHWFHWFSYHRFKLNYTTHYLYWFSSLQSVDCGTSQSP